MALGNELMSTERPIVWPASKHIRTIGLVLFLFLTAFILPLLLVNPQGTYPHPTLLATLNMLFLSVLLFLVAFVAIKSYLASGLLQLLLISSSMVAFGTTVLMNSMAILLPDVETTTNFLVTTYNIMLLLFAALNLLAVMSIFYWRPRERTERDRANKAIMAFIASTLISLTVYGLTAVNIIPPFWEGSSTSLRDATLITAAVLLTTGCIHLALLYRETRSPIVHWYVLGLAMYALGIYSIVMADTFDNLLIWAGRMAQYSGSVFLTISVLASLSGERWSNAFARSKLQFDNLFATMSEAFAYLQVMRDQTRRPVDYRYAKVNSAFERVTGLTGVTGRLGSEVHGNMPDLLRCVQKVDAGGRIDRTELNSEGDRYFIVSAYSVERDYVAVMFADITESKRNEVALKENESRYRSLFEINREVVSMQRVVRDESGTIVDTVMVDANPAAISIWGFSSPEDIRGRRLSELFSKETVEERLEHIRKAMLGPEPYTVEMRFNDRTLLSTFERMDEQNVIISSADITEVRSAQRWLEDYTKRLERSNAELQQFAYVTSHDLQEPLRMTTAYLQLLESRAGDELDDESREYLDFAVDGGKRMKQMIDDLLSYSRVESGRQELKAVDMNKALSQSLNDLRVSIEESGASVTYGPLPTVVANLEQVVQLLVNLIGNAIKYRGKDPPHIHVSANRNGHETVFSVRDNGIGIEPRFQERIFQMFQRLHTREEYPGTGIGLAIVKKIVEVHGGRVWVESEMKKGSTFFFTLPGSPPAH